MSKHSEFYRPGAPIPRERMMEAVDTVVLHLKAGPFARVIERGQIVDQDDEAVRLAPANFRRPAGPIVTRQAG
jgi:hypothetical protein